MKYIDDNQSQLEESCIIIHVLIQFLSACLVLFFKKEKYQYLLQKYCHF